MKKRSWLLLLLFLPFLSGCYLAQQGLGQFDLTWSQVPLDKAIGQTPDPEIQNLLKEAKAIKHWGESKMGLSPTKNFEGYYATSQEGITFVVTAAPADRLEPYLWWYPILGNLPYKGFFEKADALKLQQELNQQGYDTWIFAAPTYSTLGWFKDPITTPMLKSGRYGLANYLLHEMTHATLFLPEQSQFNEQLASFVANKGTELYLLQTGKMTPAELAEIQARQEKMQTYARLAHQAYQRMQTRYQNAAKPEERLLIKKQELARLDQELKSAFPEIDPSHLRFNHARLQLFVLYDEENPLFEEFWNRAEGNWPKFWGEVKKYAQSQGWNTQRSGLLQFLPLDAFEGSH